MSENCKEKIWNGYDRCRCSRRAVTDGYCKQHHPDAKARRRKKQDAKWRLERESEKANTRLRAIRLLESELCESCLARTKAGP